jgi:hypothetical protein
MLFGIGQSYLSDGFTPEGEMQIPIFGNAAAESGQIQSP